MKIKDRRKKKVAVKVERRTGKRGDFNPYSDNAGQMTADLPEEAAVAGGDDRSYGYDIGSPSTSIGRIYRSRTLADMKKVKVGASSITRPGPETRPPTGDNLKF